jgi:hypothetical protein
MGGEKRCPGTRAGAGGPGSNLENSRLTVNTSASFPIQLFRLRYGVSFAVVLRARGRGLVDLKFPKATQISSHKGILGISKATAATESNRVMQIAAEGAMM